MSQKLPFLTCALVTLIFHPAHALQASAASGVPDELPALVRVHRAGGEEITLDQLTLELAKADAVFLGETHLDETTHAFEQLVYEQLCDARDGKVILALEMFERDVQGVLDDYLAGRIAEADFLARSRPWSNYATGYRPLIELARARQLPVVASNGPGSLLRKVSGGGKAALAALSDAEQPLLAAEIFPNSEHYWQRFHRSTRSHGGAAPPAPEAMLYSTQSLWDNTMGESCARALAQHPDASVLHVNGGFHSEFHEGTVAQLLRRRPATTVATVSINPVRALPTGAREEEWEAGVADYVVLTHQRGRDVFEGSYAVPTESELCYQLWLPPSASAEAPVPLLIWLTSEGALARDCLAWLKLALGEQAAVAVVEGLRPEPDDDLHLAHRWFLSDTFDHFAKDLSAAHAGVARIAGYLRRRLPVRGDTVVVAGEGEGATVLAGASLNLSSFEWRGVGFAPRSFRALRFLTLPEKNARCQGLQMFVAERDLAWWQEEASQYGGIGLQASVRSYGDAVPSLSAIEDELRTALGLRSRPRALQENDSTTLLTTLTSSPLARWWLRWHARLAEERGERVSARPDQAGVPGTPPWESVRLLCVAGEDPGTTKEPPAWGPASFANGTGLPLAPGSFGGTTILYVPHADGEGERAAWLRLETDNVLKKRSPFANLVVAFADGDHTLFTALSALRAKARRSVLIVPAAFCAPPGLMRSLQEIVAPMAEDFEISWLPGLGGELARAR
ncbi:MAG: ChaN family lipoprotein [Planctomycetota bacterium]